MTRTKAVPAAEIKPWLRKLKWLGLAVLAVQFLIMSGWSAFEVHRFAETADFAGFYRAWYLIGHGTLNPGPGWASVGPGWWTTQGVFIMWPLAVFAVIAPHPVTLLIIQNAAVVAAEAVAYFWLLEIAGERSTLPLRDVAIFGVAITVLNPWVYWAVSGDYHSEAIGTLFMLLASRAFYYHRRSAWIWVALTMVSGLVASTYLLGVALGLALVRGNRRNAVILGAATLVWLFVMLKIGVGGGLLAGPARQTHQEAANPIGSALHEIGIVLRAIPNLWPQMLVLIAPALFIGILSAPTIGVAAVVIGTSTTTGLAGLSQFFQNIALYIYMPVGTMIVLATFSRRFGLRRTRIAMILIVLSSLGWCAVWLPALPAHYAHVSSGQTAALDSATRMIPPDGDLIVSQGVAGVLAGRHKLLPLMAGLPLRVAIPRQGAWWLITPYAGVEPQDVRTSSSIIASLSKNPHARLVFERDGIWLFRWAPAKHTTLFDLEKPYQELPAALFGTDGVRHVQGGAASWALSSQRANTLVLYGDYWDKQVGQYEGQVSVNTAGPVIVRLWDATTDTVLQAKRLSRTSGTRVVRLRGAVTRSDPDTVSEPYRGAGPFAIMPISAYRGNNLELTVQALTNAPVTVSSVGLHAVSSASSGG